MSVNADYIGKESGRVNALMEFWGCTKSSRYHADKFYTYITCPNKRDPYFSEKSKNPIQ